jgi:hypothetical protein
MSGIKPGDIVRAGGDHAVIHAVVVRKERRWLVVQGIGDGGLRRLRADEVDAHWRRVGLRRGTVPPTPRHTDEVAP